MGCAKLVLAKKLGDDCEPRLLQWLDGGRRLPERSQGAEHKAQFLSDESFGNFGFGLR